MCDINLDVLMLTIAQAQPHTITMLYNKKCSTVRIVNISLVFAMYGSDSSSLSFRVIGCCCCFSSFCILCSLFFSVFISLVRSIALQFSLFRLLVLNDDSHTTHTLKRNININGKANHITNVDTSSDRLIESQ